MVPFVLSWGSILRVYDFFAYGVFLYSAQRLLILSGGGPQCLHLCVCVSPGPAADELWEAGRDHYTDFWKLREHFVDEEMPLFQMTQKAHSCLHACLLSSVMNPRRTWCFKFEDCAVSVFLYIPPHASFEMRCLLNIRFTFVLYLCCGHPRLRITWGTCADLLTAAETHQAWK